MNPIWGTLKRNHLRQPSKTRIGVSRPIELPPHGPPIRFVPTRAGRSCRRRRRAQQCCAVIGVAARWIPTGPAALFVATAASASASRRAFVSAAAAADSATGSERGNCKSNGSAPNAVNRSLSRTSCLPRFGVTAPRGSAAATPVRAAMRSGRCSCSAWRSWPHSCCSANYSRRSHDRAR